MTYGRGNAYERMLSEAVAALHERDPDRLWPLLAETLPGVCGGEALIYKLDEWNESSGTVGLPPGGAAAFAALLSGKNRPAPAEKRELAIVFDNSESGPDRRLAVAEGSQPRAHEPRSELVHERPGIRDGRGRSG